MDNHMNNYRGLPNPTDSPAEVLNNPTGMLSTIYKHVDLNDACASLFIELQSLANNNGTLDLNIAIKDDIAIKFTKNRSWVNHNLHKLELLCFITDVTNGRYQINQGTHLVNMIRKMQSNELDEVIFQITFLPKENGKKVKLVSFQ